MCTFPVVSLWHTLFTMFCCWNQRPIALSGSESSRLSEYRIIFALTSVCYHYILLYFRQTVSTFVESRCWAGPFDTAPLDNVERCWNMLRRVWFRLNFVSTSSRHFCCSRNVEAVWHALSTPLNIETFVVIHCSHTNVFSTSVFSTQVEPNLTKLRTITKQEVFFQVLVLIFRSV